MPSIFSRIISGELPARFVYRDDRVVAFLDIEPITYGHVLVVPVKEVNLWTDMAPEDWAYLNEVAQRIGRAAIKAFDAQRAGYVIAGFDVPHTHIHVFPANDMSVFDLSDKADLDEADLDRAADQLRQALES